jgi:hypothetical protein
VGSWPALRSDGGTTRLETDDEVASRGGAPYHPGLDKSDAGRAGTAVGAAGDTEVDGLELFYWELTGFLVVRGALGAAHLAAANAVVEKHLPSVDFEAAARQRLATGGAVI